MLIILLLLFVAAQQLIAVVLTSTLSGDRFICSGEVVIFTCTTRGSPILEWFSEEYIGTGGDRLQILSGSDRNTSSVNPDAVATRINVTNDNGETVIVSELRIIASISYPIATVSCSSGDQRLMQNITFRIFAVTVNSTLNAEHVAHPQDIITFTCTTRGSPILEWFSEEYIGTGGNRLQILSGSNRNTSSISPDVVATRLNVITENKIIVIVSELKIVASIRYPIATVSCSNGSPKRSNVTFQTVERGIVNDSTVTTRVTQIRTSTIELSTDDVVGDTNLAHIPLGTGAISGITIAVVVVIIIIILSSLVILVIIKKHTQVQGRSRVTHGYENAVTTKEMKQDLPKKSQLSEYQEKLTMDQENTNISESSRNKQAQVKSTASRLSWDSGYPNQKYVE